MSDGFWSNETLSDVASETKCDALWTHSSLVHVGHPRCLVGSSECAKLPIIKRKYVKSRRHRADDGLRK